MSSLSQAGYSSTWRVDESVGGNYLSPLWQAILVDHRAPTGLAAYHFAKYLSRCPTSRDTATATSPPVSNTARLMNPNTRLNARPR